jgi:ABC-type branched-subunit amino acid transport system ATPase component
MTLLQVNEINVSYGRAMVLHDISMHLKQGEMVFVVGRNGAGKTTLLKTLMGLLQPGKGSILYEGEKILGTGPVKLAQKGLRYVAQDKKVFSGLSVRDNIALAAHSFGVSLPEAIANVTSIYPKMNDFMDNKAGGLSGGQRELLLIGRALVGHPKLLLVDEPTEGVAPIVIKEIGRILTQLKTENISAIIVEQNLSMVNQLADRIYVMRDGYIIKEMDNSEKNKDNNELESYL